LSGRTDYILGKYKKNKIDLSFVNNLSCNYIEALAKIEDNNLQKKLLKELIQKYVALEKRVDALLKNTLPENVAEEIKYEGKFAPHLYECTILFTDFVGFTHLAEKISAEVLINVLDKLFKKFDDLIISFHGTKIKTIGDAYMAVFGAPIEYDEHAVMAVRAGLALLNLVNTFNKENNQNFQMRLGIHTGKVMAGVVGKERMQFDVFGDNVNIASRFESSGKEGKVNVSYETYKKIRHLFEFEKRGQISLKNKANMKAYFALRELKKGADE
jgi:adenylate cyclase